MTPARTTTHPNRVAEPAPDPVRTQRDLDRVTTNARARLLRLGIPTDEHDSAGEVMAMLEAIERFELVVRGRGGDLMVDEPPPGSRPQPDREEHALPLRAPHEPAALYVGRVVRAAERVARAKP